MSSIKFNQLTKETEVKGPESFIGSNFNEIRDLLIESFGVKKTMLSRKATEKPNQEPISFMKLHGSQKGIASPISPLKNSPTPNIPNEIKTNRPPLRKYIRKVGIPDQERIVVEVVEQKSKEISVESLKEKFGLSSSQIGGIIRDAEKLGKIKRVISGSYAWTQD